MVKKPLINQGVALLFGVALGGFGWMAIRGFADLWMNLTPFQTLLTGLGGILIIGWLIKSLGIKVRKIFS